ncbi:class I SAM-dependent methyltransferase [uncultured Luteimonas sp.]|uniref:class I SAM-dependent methyltransferase n=1 Tax=uncultured Luteimonas sp. TaxID=453144 RepID=UPI00263102B3|nr:class I SAM-dependent methyltransferase [uncultured Luteimonas sp.]
MTKDPLLGPIYTDLGWVPAPRYLMRRARIKALLHDIPSGRLLEIGPGAGALLVEFMDAGYRCEALDSSSAARTRTQSMLSAAGHDVPVHAEPGLDWAGRFDVICAFEVLEHIEDDIAAVELWRSWLRPGGHLIMSVPAHMKLWTARDEWAGHVRRYERDELVSALDRGGFDCVRFECYGFPLTNLTEWASQPLFARNIHRGDDPTEDRRKNNDRSGIDRGPDMKLFPLVRSLPGKLALRTFDIIQRGFLDTDLGSGYVVKAQARST